MTDVVVEEDAADDGAVGVPWQRLSLRIVPAALLRMLVRLVPAAAGWWFFNTDNDVARWTVVALTVLAVVNPLNQALNYLKVRYRLTGEELQHTTGLLVRRSNRIALHRIRTVDITAPLSNRLFGLAVLRIGTGGNAMLGEGTVALDGLPRATALALRAELLRRSEQDVTSTVEPRLAQTGGEEVQTLRWRWVVYQMFGAWLVAGPLSVVGTTYGFASLLGREEWVGDQVMSLVDRVPWAAWALSTLVLAVLLGIGAGVVTFAEAWWGYRLVREPDGRFLATRGLLTTRSFTADQDRLRGVTIGRGLVTRLLGGARLSPVMTGVSLAQMMSESSTLLPVTTRDVAVRVGNVLLGRTVLDDDVAPAGGPLLAHPPVARRRAVVRYLLATAAVGLVLGAGVVWGGWSGWLLLLPAALVPVSAIGGRGYYRALGHRLDGEYLYLQRGYFSRRTDVIQVRGINGAHVSQSLVQRLLGLATLAVTTAAGEQAYYGVDMALGDATALAAMVTQQRLAG